MTEKIIISLTSYGVRLGNLPTVLDSIYCQTIPPDFVVLNLAHDEIVPDDVLNYLSEHNVEINRVPDTKVYKKLIPTLKKYPNDIVISIDDDWLYPQGMITDFLEVHSKHPNNPISGNGVVFSEMICHCGCASLTKADYFHPYLEDINDVIQNCPCDDIAYTYFANKAGHPYIVTQNKYFTNMTPYNEGESYSKRIGSDSIEKSFSYLETTYGKLPFFINSYIRDTDMAEILHHIYSQNIIFEKEETRNKTMDEIRATYAYRLGKLFLKPFYFIRHFFYH